MSAANAARQATAIEYAIAVVAARSLPQKKLRERLLARYAAEEAETALARMRELGLVDDVAWAERFARDRCERSGKGSHRIRSELLSRGIDAATAEAALAAAVDPEIERRKAEAVLETMRTRLDRGEQPTPGAASTGNLRTRPLARESEHLRNRLFRRMIARGYPASLVRDLLGVS